MNLAIRPRQLAVLLSATVLWAPAEAAARRNAAPAKPPAAAPAKPAPTSAAAAPTTAPATGPAPSPGAAEGPPPAGSDVPSDGDVTRYTFTGLDIDGELRTPALLQFLARIGGEFETVGIPHRSFMPELSFTVTEDAL